MLRIFEKIVDNYKVDPGKLDSLVLRKGLCLSDPLLVLVTFLIYMGRMLVEAGNMSRHFFQSMGTTFTKTPHRQLVLISYLYAILLVNKFAIYVRVSKTVYFS